MPRYGEMVAQAELLCRQSGLASGRRRAVDACLRHREESTRLCQEIRDWPGRAGALLAERPGPDATLDALIEQRKRVASLLAEAGAMRAKESPHAPHLNALPDEREALLEAARRLDRGLVAAELAEANRLATMTRRFAEKTGGLAFDARGYAELMERVRSLDARPDLAKGDLRGRLQGLLARDERWTRDRDRVVAFLERAGEVERARTTPAEGRPDHDWRRKAGQILDEAKALRKDIVKHELAAHLRAVGAAPDALEAKEETIGNRIALDEQAHKEQLSQGGGLSM